MALSKTDSPLSNPRFLLFFISQSFVGCGAFIQVVAVARLILQSTNSGVAAGFSIICAPLPGIVFSLLAGSLGDRRGPKSLLIVFDVLRGTLVLLFIFSKSMPAIFTLMLLVSLVDVLYSPSKNKILTSVLEKDDFIRGNSLLSGSQGAVSLVIPMLIGLIISVFSINTAFILGGISYFLSAFFLSGIDFKACGQPFQKQNNRREIAQGLAYCFHNTSLKSVILALTVFDFGAVCVNISFYALAFDTLNVTSSTWGLILSIFYGMNIVAMLLLLQYRKRFKKAPVVKAFMLQIAVALVWVYYGMTDNLYYILIGVAAEGLFSALSTTLLMTHILEVSRTDYTARVMSIRDLCSNIAKAAGIGLTYLLLKDCGAAAVFIVSAFIVSAFIIFQAAKWIGAKKTKSC